MTVSQYVTKFERLSRYAPELVNTEEKKIMKFLEGLNPIIERDATSVVLPTTLQEAVKRAYKFEDINNKIIQDVRRKRQQQGQRSHRGKKSRQDQNTQGQGGCEHCGKNHPSHLCYRVTGGCLKCGFTDHLMKDCPNNRNQGNKPPQQDQQAAQDQPRQPQQQNQQQWPRQQPQNQNARPPQ